MRTAVNNAVARVTGLALLLAALVPARAQNPPQSQTNGLAELSRQVAALYQQAKYAEAIPVAQQALARCEQTFGSEHPDTASSLNNLAALYESTGNYAKAEALYQRALSIREKALGREHPDTAMSLNNLAELYEHMGNYAKAEPLYQCALGIYERALGPEHPATAMSLNNLAALYRNMGNYAKAEPFYQRALIIAENALGPEHPNTAICLENLGFLYMEMGRNSEVLRFAHKTEQARLGGLANILSFAAEAQRLEYQARQNPYSLYATLGAGAGVAAVILHHKGVVLDSLLEDRLVAEASRNPADHATIERVQAAKQQLARLTLEVPKDFSSQAVKARAAEREKLFQEVDPLEGTLARRVAGLGRARRSLRVTVEQAQSAIPKEVALVELIGYPHYLGTNKWEWRYGAAVLASSGQPQWVCLGACTNLAPNIKLYLQTVRHKTQDAQLPALLQKLYRQVWSPIEAALPAGIRTVILCPDAQLNFVSFATLLAPDGRFLGQKYSLCYVASGRDLLRETSPSPSTEMVVYANPDFSGQSPIATKPATNSVLAMREVETRDFGIIELRPLPGTARESAELAALAKRWEWPASTFVGAAATEAQLRGVRSPRILHLATHGFFLPDTQKEAPTSGRGFRGIAGLNSFGTLNLLADSEEPMPRPVLLKNPMHRSGLALAGAQATLEAWKRGEVPPMENDGILTAEEVGTLKLEGTWLVVLSACDTGVGEARAGEGVLGLRRGFIQAGAQNLLMTLWPVDDEATSSLMVDFYTAAHKSGNAPQALADVQRDWLVRLRQERGLAEAVRIAGPFIMSSQGPPK